MEKQKITNIIEDVIKNMPSDWLRLTTHRLDIYNEVMAKVEFLDKFEKIGLFSKDELDKLPTAFDYIRLGHPLSCLLEWAIAKSNDIEVNNIISFSSQVMPIFAVLRKNLFENIKTQIIYKDNLPECFETEIIKNVYAYNFELVKVNNYDEVKNFDGSTIVLTSFDEILSNDFKEEINFIVSIHNNFGSIIQVIGNDCEKYVKEIQHVRRRESIAMTPHDCLSVLKLFTGTKMNKESESFNTDSLVKTINEVTSTNGVVSIGSCGLSVQYAIMMGLVHHAKENHKDKDIKFIVPPNCYGGTNDQARRVAACIANVEILDLPVDGGKNMVEELDILLEKVAHIDAVPYIIAEIPTNPRVEVPDLKKLKETLIKKRKNGNGSSSVSPVFILDQTFCPNVKFLGERDFLYDAQTISYVSGSKFPSGGLCTAGYCVANEKAKALMVYIDRHLNICQNRATDFQIETLTKQMPSMNERIDKAYKNTRDFVNFIQKTLPKAKINFVSEELANVGFTPSVFSLDLPTKGDNPDERESYKRELNLKLINMMIDQIADDSKHCVSYGQLKGCYWTIPATSTQGTTKETDKDYIVRVAVSPDLDLEKHKKVFSEFCKEIT